MRFRNGGGGGGARARPRAVRRDEGCRRDRDGLPDSAPILAPALIQGKDRGPRHGKADEQKIAKLKAQSEDLRRENDLLKKQVRVGAAVGLSVLPEGCRGGSVSGGWRVGRVWLQRQMASAVRAAADVGLGSGVQWSAPAILL